MLNIAITGGIGSGKTLAADHLRELGYTVIDADAMAREMTAPGGRALPLIREEFGDCLFNKDGSLNRAAVRDMIYDDPEKKSRYEACTTRLVLDDIAEIKKDLENSGEEVIFYDIPLLFETGTDDKYDRVWVVTADDEIRKQRVMDRNALDENTIERIMLRQTPEDIKIAGADCVIYNNGTIEELHSGVEKALKTFLK